MPALYLYGFLRCPEEPELPLSGLAEEPLYPLYYQGIAAAVSYFPGRFVPLTETNLMAHEGTLEVIMEQYPVLPARFATLLPDERTVLSLLSQHCNDLHSNLSQVQGKVEFGLKALWNPPPAPSQFRVSSSRLQEANTRNSKPETAVASPGTSYLLRLLHEEHRRRHTHNQADGFILFIDASLSPYASQKRLCPLPTDRMLLNAAYLVPKDNISAFKGAFYHLQNSAPTLNFLLSGPWPPYNFVSLKIQLPSLDSPRPNILPDLLFPLSQPPLEHVAKPKAASL